MTRSLPVLLALIATASGLPPRSPAAQQPVFRTGTEVVLVNALVTRGRSPVTGLGADDFELTDNGVRQEVDVLALDGRAIDVTFVSSAVFESQTDRVERIHESSNAFRALLRPDDRLRVIVAGERVQERAMRPARDATGFGPHLGRGLGSSLNDALVYALMRPADPERGHLVVIYTGGLESWSTLGAERVVQVAARADAVLHAVVVGRPRPSMPAKSAGVRSDSGTVSITWHGSLLPELEAEWRATYGAIDTAVRHTGGSLHHVGAGENAFAEVLDDFRSSYLLRYTPRGVGSSGWHEIAVKVRRPGSFTVRAKKGYERDR